MSRSGMYLVDLTTTASSVDAINSARKVISLSPLQPAAFAYSPLFVYFEQYLVIYKELITNFLLALAAVAVLSLLVLGRFRIVLLVCFTVVMIDIELLGFVHHWGLQVNAITVIELIMAVGLVVDYMVHIVHYYLLQDPEVEKDLRIGRALGEIGPSVTIGAATTFLGIMPMAFASNAIFRVFFKMFLVIIIFGYVHGVIFVPVALSLLPEPSPVRFLANGERGREAAGAEVKEEEPDPMGLHFAVPASGTRLHVCALCSARQAPGGELHDTITTEYSARSSGGGSGGGGGGSGGCRGTGRGRGPSATSGGDWRRHAGGGGAATVAPGSVAGEGVDDGGRRFGERADSDAVGGEGGGGGGGTPEDSRSSFDGEGDGDRGGAYGSYEEGDGGAHGTYEAGGSEAAAEAGREGGEHGEGGGDRKLNDGMEAVHYSLANDNRRLGPRFRAEPRRETGPPTTTNLGSRSESNNSLARFDSRSSSVSTLNSLAWSSSMLSRNSSLVSATNSLFATGPIYPAGAATASTGPLPLDVPPPPRSPASMRHDTVEIMDPAIHRWSLQQPPRRVHPARDSPEPSRYAERLAMARPTSMPTERREGFKMWPSRKARQTVVPWTWQVD